MGGARLIWVLIIALFGFIGGSMLLHDWQGGHKDIATTVGQKGNAALDAVRKAAREREKEAFSRNGSNAAQQASASDRKSKGTNDGTSSKWSIPTGITPQYKGFYENAGTIAKTIAPKFTSESIPGWRIPTDAASLKKFGLPEVSQPFTGFAAAAKPAVKSVWSVPTAITPVYKGFHENAGTIAKSIAPNFSSKSIPGWRIPTDAAALKKFGPPAVSAPFTGFASAAGDLVKEGGSTSVWKVPTAPTPDEASGKNKGVIKKLVDFFKGDEEKIAKVATPKTRSSKAVRDDAKAKLKFGETQVLPNEHVRISGHAGGADKLLVYVNKKFLGEAHLLQDGNWVYETSDPMPKGPLNFEIQQVEASGIVIANVSNSFNKTSGIDMAALAAGAKAKPQSAEVPKKKVELNLPPTGITPTTRVISDSGHRAQKKKQLATHQRVATSTPATGGNYLVVKGDTLWKIAHKMLGDGERYREIYRLNKTDVYDPHFIKPGQILKLP